MGLDPEDGAKLVAMRTVALMICAGILSAAFCQDGGESKEVATPAYRSMTGEPAHTRPARMVNGPRIVQSRCTIHGNRSAGPSVNSRWETR